MLRSRGAAEKSGCSAPTGLLRQGQEWGRYAWVDVLEKREFPGSWEPSGPTDVAHSSLLKASPKDGAEVCALQDNTLLLPKHHSQLFS